MDRLLLTGDIGATKAHMMVVAPGEGGPRVVVEGTYVSRQHRGLGELATELLRGSGLQPRVGSFSVAGPVVGRRARLPNLGWELDEGELRRELGLETVLLVNDLQATARAVPHLTDDQLLTLQEGRPAAEGPRGVIAPGTGLGEALLVPDGSGIYTPVPSEGGHAAFAPTGELQRSLHAFLEAENGYVSNEDVCSGIGIANIHRFLRATGRAEDDRALSDEIAAADDPTPLIVETALAEPEAETACARALALFVEILGAETGNLALRGLTTGGVYLGGGIPPRIPSLLRSPAFLNGLQRKGLMSAVVRSVPVRLILEPRAALWGAVYYGIVLLDAASRATRTGGALSPG